MLSHTINIDSRFFLFFRLHHMPVVLSAVFIMVIFQSLRGASLFNKVSPPVTESPHLKPHFITQASPSLVSLRNPHYQPILHLQSTSMPPFTQLRPIFSSQLCHFLFLSLTMSEPHYQLTPLLSSDTISHPPL